MKYQTTVEKLPASRVKISVEIPFKDLDQYKEKALEEIAKNIEVDGFRKGNVPVEVAAKKVGSMAVLSEMADMAISHAYPTILMEEKIDAIGRPAVVITKLAEGNPLAFTIETDVIPSLEIADYKKLAKKHLAKKPDVTVEQKEIDEAFATLRKIRHQSKLAQETEDATQVPAMDDIKLEDIPELTDEDAQAFGDFKTIADFTKELTKNMEDEKLQKETAKIESEFLDALVKESTVDLPAIIVDHEVSTMIARFEYDLMQSGATFEDYLKNTNKTKDHVKADMREGAIHRATMQMIINDIAIKEDLKADEAMLTKELEHFNQTYKDQKDYSEDRAKAYLETVWLNKAVMDFLRESAAGKKKAPTKKTAKKESSEDTKTEKLKKKPSTKKKTTAKKKDNK